MVVGLAELTRSGSSAEFRSRLAVRRTTPILLTLGRFMPMLRTLVFRLRRSTFRSMMQLRLLLCRVRRRCPPLAGPTCLLTMVTPRLL